MVALARTRSGIVDPYLGSLQLPVTGWRGSPLPLSPPNASSNTATGCPPEISHFPCATTTGKLLIPRETHGDRKVVGQHLDRPGRMTGSLVQAGPGRPPSSTASCASARRSSGSSIQTRSPSPGGRGVGCPSRRSSARIFPPSPENPPRACDFNRLRLAPGG